MAGTLRFAAALKTLNAEDRSDMFSGRTRITCMRVACGAGVLENCRIERIGDAIRGLGNAGFAAPTSGRQPEGARSRWRNETAMLSNVGCNTKSGDVVAIRSSDFNTHHVTWRTLYRRRLSSSTYLRTMCIPVTCRS